MKHLMILRNDCGNLALFPLYSELKRRGHTIDLYSCSMNTNDIVMFGEEAPIQDIGALSNVDLNAYASVIVSRNCFIADQLEAQLLAYQGLIVTEHTSLYEGNNVFGDLVLVNGLHNVDTIPIQLRDVPIIVVGNLKGASHFTNDRVKVGMNYALFAESGHYPHGSKGRRQIAQRILQLCDAHRDIDFVVKPRYLQNECKDAYHRNADHIFPYFLTECGNRPPENLHLLNRHYPLDTLVKPCSVMLHTYSSSFGEAIYQNKKIVNMTGIPTEETADYRKNRFQAIKNYIDPARCNFEISGAWDLGDAKHCDPRYQKELCSPVPDSSRLAVDVIEQEISRRIEHQAAKPDVFSDMPTQYIPMDPIRIRNRRLEAIAKNRLAYYEYVFDDYFGLQDGFGRICAKIQKEQVDHPRLLFLIEDELANYINRNFERLCSNRFDQAALLQYLYQHGRMNEVFSCIWGRCLCAESFLYYMGLYWADQQDWTKAKKLLHQYLVLEERKLYDETIADRAANRTHAKYLIECIENQS